MMGQAPAEYLPTVIATLQNLQDESAERHETMLAFLLDLARTEAEDRLRQAGLDADTRAALRDTSTIGFLTDIGSTPPEPRQVQRRTAPAKRARRGPRQTA